MKRRGDKGFTLVEVLVAFTILAVTLGAVYDGLSTGLAQEHAAEQATARVLEARSVLDRLGADLPLTAGRLEGRLANGEAWSVALAPVTLAAGGGLETPPVRAWEAVLRIEATHGPALVLRTLKLEW